MRIKIRDLLKPQSLAFVFAMAMVPFLIMLTRYTIDQLTVSRTWLEHTYTALSRIEQLRSDMETVETARRGFFITRQEQYIQPYHVARQKVFENLDGLQRLLLDNPAQKARLKDVRPIIESLVDLANRDFEAVRSEAKHPHDTMAQAKFLIDQGRQLLEQMKSEERELLIKRTAEMDSRQQNLNLVMAGMTGGFLLLLLFSFFTAHRENLRRLRIEQGLRESEVVSDRTVRHLSLMQEMTSLLQACNDFGESVDVIRQSAERLFKTDGGALYLFRESRNQLEAALTWGDSNNSKTMFHPEDCWALKRGEPHKLDHKHHLLACNHMREAADACSLCMPVVAQGNVLGIFYLQGNPDQAISDVEYRLAATLASQVALALSNIRLRDTLRDLSVRDPLTGLFNRRYMEESLQREIATAKRKDRQLGVAILDLDHFKKFNDTFGHDAGDLLLRETGALLQQNSRAGDIACRFGGEEFVMIYPEASPEIIVKLAEDLRQAIHAMQVQHYGRPLGQVSASFGLAFFPRHGDTTDALLRAADIALYEAKAAGRNCVQQAP